jgi:hypothetical protein
VPEIEEVIDRRAEHKRRWDRTLLPQLEGIRHDLGLPEDSRLKVSLHNLLIYEPGQFFIPHQDSERADDMIATLVILLPSAFSVGEMEERFAFSPTPARAVHGCDARCGGRHPSLGVYGEPCREACTGILGRVLSGSRRCRSNCGPTAHAARTDCGSR